MKRTPRIIRDRKTFLEEYQDLHSSDIICGKIPMKAGEEQLLVDLLSRQIRLIPSATAQLASRSKTYQAQIFKPWMVPDTAVVYDIHHLLELTNHYNRQGITSVILKQERKNAGIGVLLYRCIEDIYNQAANNGLVFPCVLQPFLEDCIDIRVILLGDYQEAYTRRNPSSFRNNLHCGGNARPCSLSSQASKICRKVMERGDFPYGHLDLLQTGDGAIYLAEVSLRGGIRGAEITTGEYRERVAAIEAKLLNRMLAEDRA